MMAIEGYTVSRRDRQGRRGGGLAIYCRKQMNAQIYTPQEKYPAEIEVLWIRLDDGIIVHYLGAVYHPHTQLTKRNV